VRILVVGGAGYIGSHMVLMLNAEGHEVTVMDDLSSGHADAVPHEQLIRGSIADGELLDRLFGAEPFDAVMHFASFIQVGESVRKPSRYYRNNVVNTINLLDAMARGGVRNFIFSSTAAIFRASDTPIGEGHPKEPGNPYGRTKLMIEQVLDDYRAAYGLNYVCLRYFNAAGADPQLRTGERHDPESHLIPLVLQAASGRRASVEVYGRDYPTPDGTCVRDYIHVLDLCSAHLLALDDLARRGESGAYNLGNGNGFSVQEVIDTARRVTGRPITVADAPRRPGDAARLVADATLARMRLGWTPQYAALERIIADAWNWERKIGVQ
jgi:UDP-glucose 4-epimerase